MKILRSRFRKVYGVQADAPHQLRFLASKPVRGMLEGLQKSYEKRETFRKRNGGR